MKKEDKVIFIYSGIVVILFILLTSVVYGIGVEQQDAERADAQKILSEVNLDVSEIENKVEEVDDEVHDINLRMEEVDTEVDELGVDLEEISIYLDRINAELYEFGPEYFVDSKDSGILSEQKYQIFRLEKEREKKAEPKLKEFDEYHKAIPLPPPYIIEPPDTVVVYVQGETGILMGGSASRDKPIRVRPDGKISLAQLGEVYIEGMTPEQASERVADLLREYIREPKVTIEMMSFNSKKVYITGAVGRQNSVSFTGNQTVLDVVLAAGYQRYGARNYRVRLYRPDPFHPKEYIINLDKLLRHGFSGDNMYVQADDIIYVEPTVFKWIGEQIGVLISPIAPIINLGSTVSNLWDLTDRLRTIGVSEGSSTTSGSVISGE